MRYLLVMAMIILTPPKGSGGMPLAPKPAVVEARVWDKLADVYPLIGAVLQKELRSVLGENVNKSISRNMKIKATKYRNDYRVWLDYAGDYRNENIE